MLRLIREGTAVTRAEMTRHTGLARSTVAARVERLLTNDLVYEVGGSAPTGGRPATVLAFNPGAGVVLAADLGAARPRLAVTDLAGVIHSQDTLNLSLSDGPEEVLRCVDEGFLELLDHAGRQLADVRGIGVGVPGPVSSVHGTVAAATLMPGWDGFPVRDWFAERYDVPAFVDRDASLMALGEYRNAWAHSDQLLYVKLDAGIGCGVVVDGEIHRGANGAAGDIGHVRVTRDTQIDCPCGNVGCLEVVAGGLALAAQLSAAGFPATSCGDVVALARAGNREALRAVRDAGRHVGDVLASIMNFFNPAAIVIGGELAQMHQQLFAGLHETIFCRSMPLAIDEVRLVTSRLGDLACVIGAATFVAEQVLTPEVIDRRLKAARAMQPA